MTVFDPKNWKRKANPKFFFIFQKIVLTLLIIIIKKIEYRTTRNTGLLLFLMGLEKTERRKAAST